MGSCSSVQAVSGGTPTVAISKSAITSFKVLTVIMLGVNNAGKSTLTAALKGEIKEFVTPTVGFASENMRVSGYTVKLFDLGGCENFRGIWPRYYAEVHGVVVVVDASDTDPAHVANTRDVIKSALSHRWLQGKPVLVFANKQDIEGALSGDRLIEMLQLSDLAIEPVCCIAKAETPTGIDPNIDRGFKQLIKEIGKRKKELIARLLHDLEEQNEINARERQERLRKLAAIKEQREREQQGPEEQEQEQEHETNVVDPLEQSNQEQIPNPENNGLEQPEPPTQHTSQNADNVDHTTEQDHSHDKPISSNSPKHVGTQESNEPSPVNQHVEPPKAEGNQHQHDDLEPELQPPPQPLPPPSPPSARKIPSHNSSAAIQMQSPHKILPPLQRKAPPNMTPLQSPHKIVFPQLPQPQSPHNALPQSPHCTHPPPISSPPHSPHQIVFPHLPQPQSPHNALPQSPHHTQPHPASPHSTSKYTSSMPPLKAGQHSVVSSNTPQQQVHTHKVSPRSYTSPRGATGLPPISPHSSASSIQREVLPPLQPRKLAPIQQSSS
ncbi:Arf/Sar family protein [Pelomyxa schiedti]|nr:Arf/Sar family protein [Pelomyxa schiedti]